MSDTLTMQASCVAIAGRALMIEGQPGSGKSALALSLIDRGAVLIGDDGVTLTREGETIAAAPPPNIAGKLEIRGVGIVELPTTRAPLCLIVSLEAGGPRFVEQAARREILGLAIPHLVLPPGDPAGALRAEWAMKIHGLVSGHWT